VAAEVLRVLPRKHLSSAMGRLSDLTGPPPLVRTAIERFVKAYDVDIDEAVVPPDGFESFDAFFTRELKPGVRPIAADPNALVSPADGRVESVGPIEDGARFLVKGRYYDAAEILGDAQDAARFRGGAFMIVYLSPRDYHRVHAPVTGRVRVARHVDGTLLPVNSLGLTYFPNLFAQNERVVTIQASPRFGDVATIMVGAIGVGRISMSYDPRIVTNRGGPVHAFEYGEEGPELTRGAQLGTFHLGSTAIVMTGPSAKLELSCAAGAVVKVGQAVARAGGA
jgi:phosphatidylserine decarboxylase